MVLSSRWTAKRESPYSLSLTPLCLAWMGLSIVYENPFASSRSEGVIASSPQPTTLPISMILRIKSGQLRLLTIFSLPLHSCCWAHLKHNAVVISEAKKWELSSLCVQIVKNCDGRRHWNFVTREHSLAREGSLAWLKIMVRSWTITLVIWHAQSVIDFPLTGTL